VQRDVTEPTMLDVITLEPGGSERRPVTLFKDLPGMGTVLGGSYVFERTIGFRFGRRPPDGSHGHRSVLELTYDVAPV
jgi:hypothetical protein